MDAKQLLEWYQEAGVDEAIGNKPVNRLKKHAPPPAPQATQTMPPRTAALKPLTSPAAAAAKSRELADACATREDLEKTVRAFDGCGLKKTAGSTVFSDGTPKARVMVIGEAPGAQEDIQGIPFCGQSGQLLDKMLSSIGLKRSENVYITNTVFWRPPGNRAPTPEELAICEPFVQKHIALIKPALLILAGGIASSAVMKRADSVGRMRGKVHEYMNPYLSIPIPAIVTFHPSYLLRSPGQKRLAWHDLCAIRTFLEN